jgi:hypothetical protein
MPGAWRDSLASVISAARASFPDLELVAPVGVLELAEALPAVERLRFEVPSGQYLHLQSIGVTATGTSDIPALASLAVSSWHPGVEDRFDIARFLDFDTPTRTVVRTGADKPAWVELAFSRPLDITGLRLRNVPGLDSTQARGITVLSASGGQDWSVVYDAAERGAELDRELAALASAPRHAGEERDLTRALLPVVAKTLLGDYRAARIALEKLDALSSEDIRAFKQVINEAVLNDRSREWTVHGAKRSFRFWGEQEKVDYVEFAAKLAGELKELTPHTCFGFGAALCTVRDGDLIPHDDDLDLIVGFEPDEAATLPEGLRRIEEFLRPRGYTVSGKHVAHRGVKIDGGQPVDVFVGLFRGDTISWYPGAFGALNRQIMYPTSDGTLLGVTCPLPRNPLIYLERLYGADWRHPDPGFTHTWNPAPYRASSVRLEPAGRTNAAAGKAGAGNRVAARDGKATAGKKSPGAKRRIPPTWRKRVRRRVRRYAAALLPRQ